MMIFSLNLQKNSDVFIPESVHEIDHITHLSIAVMNKIENLANANSHRGLVTSYGVRQPDKHLFR